MTASMLELEVAVGAASARGREAILQSLSEQGVDVEITDSGDPRTEVRLKVKRCGELVEERLATVDPRVYDSDPDSPAMEETICWALTRIETEV